MQRQRLFWLLFIVVSASLGENVTWFKRNSWHDFSSILLLVSRISPIPIIYFSAIFICVKMNVNDTSMIVYLGVIDTIVQKYKLGSIQWQIDVVYHQVD